MGLLGSYKGLNDSEIQNLLPVSPMKRWQKDPECTDGPGRPRELFINFLDAREGVKITTETEIANGIWIFLDLDL